METGMRIYQSLAEAAGRERGCVAAAGNFDGVHRGHQMVFRTAAGVAREAGGAPLVLTFASHPAAELDPENAPAPLTTLADRLALAERLGMEAALVLPFTREVSGLSPRDFVRRVLVETLSARALVVGEGWRFGRGRSGDAALLRRMGEADGFSLAEVPPVTEGGSPVSSTRVREAVAAGDLSRARLLLGRPHLLRGTVVRGEGRGRGLGFPTVNLVTEVLLPPPGIYVGACAPVEGGWLAPAAVFLGRRLTFGGGPAVVEAHLLGREEELYGRTLILAFLQRLRGERAFPDPARLSRQIAEDVRATAERFPSLAPSQLP